MKAADDKAKSGDAAAAETVDIFIREAIKQGATDIHVEPHQRHVVVRYRVDGLLKEANKLPHKLNTLIVKQVKHLADLNVDELRAPQAGQFKMEEADQSYTVRVSALPTIYGEKIVMKLINESREPADLAELGFWGDGLRQLHHAIVQPHGLVLLSGPVSSGKSTTLLSILTSLSTPRVNISTIEDPVEYRISGATQVQLDDTAGISFADGLKVLLKQDANIIMVEELRDSPTAELAVEAALSGLLVFSTLPTVDAASSLTRLVDMGVEPFLVASTFRAVVGQRLVRKLCQKCREAYVPDAGNLQRIFSSFDISTRGGIGRINELEMEALESGIGTETGSTATAIRKLYRAHKDGCSNCNHTGYKGRHGIFEVLASSGEVQKAVVSGARPQLIRKAAIEQGMVDLQLDGLIKALLGLTTVDEVLRVKA